MWLSGKCNLAENWEIKMKQKGMDRSDTGYGFMARITCILRLRA